jgi:predicted DNA-binding protein (MmcQ/YjbR family)
MAVTFAQLRAIAMAMPEATEELTWGSDTNWRVRGKMFAITGTEESAEGVSLKASKEDQAELVASRSETFSVAPYVGRFGWINVMFATVDAEELRELVVEAWRLTAPKRLVAQHDPH